MSATDYLGYIYRSKITSSKRRPRSEVGIYLRTHTHAWTETGKHTWPSGTVDVVFTCRQCGSVIATSDIEVEPSE